MYSYYIEYQVIWIFLKCTGTVFCCIFVFFSFCRIQFYFKTRTIRLYSPYLFHFCIMSGFYSWETLSLRILRVSFQTLDFVFSAKKKKKSRSTDPNIRLLIFSKNSELNRNKFSMPEIFYFIWAICLLMKKKKFNSENSVPTQKRKHFSCKIFLLTAFIAKNFN